MQVLRSRVLLTPRDFAASVAFYEGALGLHRSREFGRPPHRGVVYFLGGGEIELSEHGEDDPVPPAPTGVRLWLQVPDATAAVDALAEAGIAVAQPPERKSWGLIQALVHDPDGLPLVLVEVPDDHPLRVDTRD